MKRLEPIVWEGKTLFPSDHLQDLVSQANTLFQLDAEGKPEVWLERRLWEVAARDGHLAGDYIDPISGPVVRVMSAQDEAYLAGYLLQASI